MLRKEVQHTSLLEDINQQHNSNNGVRQAKALLGGNRVFTQATWARISSCPSSPDHSQHGQVRGATVSSPHAH